MILRHSRLLRFNQCVLTFTNLTTLLAVLSSVFLIKIIIIIIIGTNVLVFQVEEKMKEKGITRDFKISWIKKQNKDIFHKVKATVDLVKTDL